LAGEVQASRHWWRTVLRKNWFPATALAYLLTALIVGSDVRWDSSAGIYCLVFGVLVGLIALLGWWVWSSAGRL
jgi:hypothetical protein